MSLLAALSLTGCATTGSTALNRPASSDAVRSVPSPIETTAVVHGERLRLVALGDGYTAGTGVDRRDSWPAQLVQLMNRSQMGWEFVAPYNLAVPSSSSEDVLTDQLPLVEGYEPDVVTLQVGANDVIIPDSGFDAQQYRDNIAAILDGLLAIVAADHIFAVTTPDHELTVRGRYLGQPGVDSSDVAAANDVLSEVAGQRGITVVDIAPVYEMVVDDPSLVIDGGPDPSARQYAGWVEIIGQAMRRALPGG